MSSSDTCESCGGPSMRPNPDCGYHATPMPDEAEKPWQATVMDQIVRKRLLIELYKLLMSGPDGEFIKPTEVLAALNKRIDELEAGDNPQGEQSHE